MRLQDQLGPDKPLQMSAANRGVRMRWYKIAMATSALGIGAWWIWTGRSEKALQDAAADKWGEHGEKASSEMECPFMAEYGKSFQESVNKGDHFPGIPTTETNTRGGHPGGAVKN